MALLFVILVLLGFVAKFLASFSVPNADRFAWGCWLAASVLWVIARI